MKNYLVYDSDEDEFIGFSFTNLKDIKEGIKRWMQETLDGPITDVKFTLKKQSSSTQGGQLKGWLIEGTVRIDCKDKEGDDYNTDFYVIPLTTFDTNNEDHIPILMNPY